MEEIDTAVIGAGVVGLAVARALALDGREVVVLEAESAIGTATSSRNSEVIHAGIYYAPGSLKARLCVRGKELLYAYCDAHGVPYRRCASSTAPACTRRRWRARCKASRRARCCRRTMPRATTTRWPAARRSRG